MIKHYKVGLRILIAIALSIPSKGNAFSKGETGGWEDSGKNSNPKNANVQTPATCGSITLTTQAEVDAFPSTYGCGEVTGLLLIAGFDDITNLDSLISLRTVGSILIRDNDKLTNLDGLSGLTRVGFCDFCGHSGLSILRNPELSDIQGLTSLHRVDGNLVISSNAKLSNLAGINGVTSVGGMVEISDNPSLTNLDGLSSIDSIGVGSGGFHGTKSLEISGNAALTNVQGLRGLTSLPAGLFIESNATLPNLDGLNSLTKIGEKTSASAGYNSDLVVRSNPSLVNIDGLGGVTAITGSLIVEANSVLADIDGLGGVTRLLGSLMISNSPALTNLDGLSSITRIGGDLWISNNSNLTSLAGLSSLTYVGAGGGPFPGLHINGNDKLANLNGLDRLSAIGGMMMISNNAKLANLDGLSLLASIGNRSPSYHESLIISKNPALISVKGLISLSSLTGELVIENNASLPNLDGLDSLKTIYGDPGNLIVRGNASLTNIKGLSSLTSVRLGSVIISNNPSLVNLDGLSSLTAIYGSAAYGGNRLEIKNNASLINVDGLSSLSQITSGSSDYLLVVDNPNLMRCCGLYKVLKAMSRKAGCKSPFSCLNVTISGNGAGCTEDDILAGGSCPPTCPQGGQAPLNKYVSAEQGWGYAPHSTNIIVQNYESGIMYELRKSKDNSLVAGPQPGSIGLYAGGITVTTEYRVLARNPKTGCENEMSTHPVINILHEPSKCSSVPVEKELYAENSSVPPGAATNILVLNGEGGVVYVLRNDRNDSWVAGPYSADVGLNTGALDTTATFNVLAIDEKTNCTAEMSQKVTVSVVGGQRTAARTRSDAGLHADAISERGTGSPLILYPNPSRGEFNVVMEDDYTGLYNLLVRDISGMTLEKQTILKDGRVAKAHVDLRQAGEGVYILSVYGNNGMTMNRKIVITN
jgi:hypothetical protein